MRTMLERMKRELYEWWRAGLRAVPGECGEYLRRRFYGFRAAHGVRVLSHVVVYHPAGLTIGTDSAITAYCQLNAAGGITIGSDVLIGPGTMIWSQNHEYSSTNKPINKQGHRRGPVVIEDDVWIAARCVILPNVTIARGTVVAAGAVVTRSTTPYSIVAGTPARQIGSRLASVEKRISPDVDLEQQEAAARGTSDSPKCDRGAME